MTDSLTKYFISGGIAGVCTLIVGHPMDTIKVKLQTMPVPKQGGKPLYTSTADCYFKTLKHEGIRGLYRGIAAPFSVVIPIFSINFFSFGLGKKLIHSDVSKPITNAELFAAGAFSGTLTTPITAPAERVKCLLQTQLTNHNAPPKYKGISDCVRQLYKKAGIRSVYKGTAATFLRDIPGTGTFFLTHDYVKKLLPRNVSTELELLETIFAGGCAGIANWMVAMPADVLKSRIQTAPDDTFPNRLRDVFKELMAKEGPIVLYRGLTPVIVRAIPANATCFFVFDLSLKYLKSAAPNL